MRRLWQALYKRQAAATVSSKTDESASGRNHPLRRTPLKRVRQVAKPRGWLWTGGDLHPLRKSASQQPKPTNNAPKLRSTQCRTASKRWRTAPEEKHSATRPNQATWVLAMKAP